MIKPEKIHPFRIWLHGIILSSYLLFFTVSIFHVHHIHFHTENCKIQLQGVPGGNPEQSSFEDLTTGCYVLNYVNSIHNLDSLVHFQLSPEIPLHVFSSLSHIDYPHLQFPHISFLRGPPTSELT